MLIGVLRMEFTLHGNDSLKGKRNVAQSLKRKLRNKFNCSVAEVESQESHTRLVLAAVMVGSDHTHIESKLTKALLMMEAISPEELTDSDMEIIQPA
jgi:uncharacterized protein